MNQASYEVLVVGGGHAGVEAALAAARLGGRVALVTLSRDSIGRMSCNPSIGGIAKSHIVCEIDALGGEMARNTDYTGIQYRTLNTRKGPAVQAHRVQNDKQAYPRRLQAVIDAVSSLDVFEEEVTALWIKDARLRGVCTARSGVIAAETVVLTAGTFLGARVLIGHQSRAEGRFGDPASDQLAASLRALGLSMDRLKTGTPPRLHKDSIDYAKLKPQPGFEPPPFFSLAARKERDRWFHVEHSGERERARCAMFHVEHESSEMAPWVPGSGQIPCWLGETNERTHEIIRENLEKSSLYGGQVTGTGVRYCPSIEDKIVKFPDRNAHHVFVEPEGRGNPRVYPNGTSNSLPVEVQEEMIHSIRGLERAEFIRPGYAIEYDFVDPTQLNHSLETREVENLFCAGQINGTTGYEEAAGQGFVAGVNALRKVRGADPVLLGRDEAYIGVLIDDLVTRGTDEPYRMFTSRAEYRLLLRQDNARFRLRALAEEIGLVRPEVLRETDGLESAVSAEMERLETTFRGQSSLAQLLRRPENTYEDLPERDAGLSSEAARQVEIRIKYGGYIQRELDKLKRARPLEEVAIPGGIDYRGIAAFRYEAAEKLDRIRPETLAQAARIPGVNPPDIAILQMHIRRMTG
ncbi:tRNA uridine-5-carboxymethylaminomethyl modification enzyme MnmG/GidA [Kiritimatiella glycovorans]|uniref:tRNA uridine 5-carboxymethylaminomethyl modification enzyme MnmG n=1 Tax=Kiritimatiella glycovorans TaxID=1307763 RepID=A0A0G3EEZ1_9BACT|nr:FAD-dependent oxidoreductase [Kiritimatiella glycovorans]AKJ63315.1 tRNA uridine 5-carboxymethylaminomethyl modification protein [Kiritimatiella glycovorans]